MTDSDATTPAGEEKSLEKWKPSVATRAELCEAIEKAFDYRGDVTITLQDGSQQEGYVFNRCADAPEPYLDMYPTEQDRHVRIFYKDIAGLHFSGRDMALGRSWAAYLARHQAKQATAKSSPTANA